MNDLDAITTFGFRGEALSSISAASKVILLTKEEEQAQGIKLQLDDGNIVSEESVPFNTGTDISIQELFYNIPARKKFLKKRETENRTITQLFQSFCLDYLHIHFKLFVDGKQTIMCPPTKDIISRTAQIWGHNFAKNMISIETEKKEGKPYIHGAVSNHQYFRYDRNNIFIFVNNRWVKNYKVQNAILKGYLNALPPARYPAAAIFIEIDPTEVDVNIHPRKEEVKFLHPLSVTNLLKQTVKEALEDHLSQQISRKVVFATSSPTNNQVQQSVSPTNQSFKTFDFDSFLKQKKADQVEASFSSNEKQTTAPKTTETITEEPQNIFEQKQEQQEQIIQKKYDIIGQFKKTYIMIEKKEGLFFVDQHAAHERILYQLFSKRFEDVATVKLMFPQIITVKQQEIPLIEEHLDVFKKNGIEIEIFGENQLIVQSTPVHIKNINIEELAQEVIAWISEYQELDKEAFFKTINEKMHAQMACKAAVKAGDVLTIEQMENLLADLEKAENRFTCPHGRPTGWILTTYEIEKKFKRTK